MLRRRKMKPLILYHDDDVLACVTFDDGTCILWHDDSPVVIARSGIEPEQYETGTVPAIDKILDDPTKLYRLPDERMDAAREKHVKAILGLP